MQSNLKNDVQYRFIIIYYRQQNAHDSNKLSKFVGNTRYTSNDWLSHKTLLRQSYKTANR